MAESYGHMQGDCTDCAKHPDTNVDKPAVGKGPGGSNDVSGYLNEARKQYQGGEIDKKQFLDRLDYYAPKGTR